MKKDYKDYLLTFISFAGPWLSYLYFYYFPSTDLSIPNGWRNDQYYVRIVRSVNLIPTFFVLLVCVIIGIINIRRLMKNKRKCIVLYIFNLISPLLLFVPIIITILYLVTSLLLPYLYSIL